MLMPLKLGPRKAESFGQDHGCENEFGPQTFPQALYLDPPYLLGTRSGKQYKFEMQDAEHEAMLNELLQSKAKIMISGYDSEMYNEYLKDWVRVEMRSCAEHGKPRKEVVWMNYEEMQLSLNL